MKKIIGKLICAIFVLIPSICLGKVTCTSSNYSALIDVSKTDLSLTEKAFISIKSDTNFIVSYSTSDNKIINVTDDGIITPLLEGTSDILVNINFIEDNETKAICSSKISMNVLSNDSSLKSLTLEEQDLTNIFNKDSLEYIVNLPYKYESVNIIATPNNSNAKVIGTGKRYLNEGVNEFNVIVTASNGTSTTYTVTVNRESASDDSTLKSLVVEGYNLEPAFNKNIYNYDLYLDKDVEEIKINASTTYEYAKITGTGKFGLTTGKTSFFITVTAENNSTQIYTINVYKNKGSSKLTNLSVEGYEIDFFEDIYMYNLTVKNKVESLKIDARVSEDDKSQVEIIGGDKLQVGENDIIIRVTSEDKTTTTYKIVVTRLSVEEQRAIAKTNTLLIILFIIFIISLIVMISCIVIFLKRYYKHNKIQKIDKEVLLKRIKK